MLYQDVSIINSEILSTLSINSDNNKIANIKTLQYTNRHNIPTPTTKTPQGLYVCTVLKSNVYGL